MGFLRKFSSQICKSKLTGGAFILLSLPLNAKVLERHSAKLQVFMLVPIRWHSNSTSKG